MPGFMLDTSCLVAAFSQLHTEHECVRLHLEARLDEGESLIVGAHTLAETYSVLTRIPRSIVGGAIYDALVVATALKAQVEALLTLNPGDMLRFAPPQLQIVRP